MSELKGGCAKMRVMPGDNLLGQDVIFKTFYGQLQFGKVIKQYAEADTNKTRVCFKSNTDEYSFFYLEEVIQQKRIFYNQ